MIDIKVPTVGESISEVTLLKWTKKEGDYVERDEVIAELESEKATFEVNAEQAGVLKTVGHEGDTLNIGQVLAKIDETASKPGGNGAVKKEQAKNKSARADAEQETVSKEPEKKKNETKVEPEKADKTIQQTATNNQEVKATPVASAI